MSTFPPELLEVIVDYTADSRTTLLSWSLTGRATRTRALSHLFKAIEIIDDASVDEFASARGLALVRMTTERFAQLSGAPLINFIQHHCTAIVAHGSAIRMDALKTLPLISHLIFVGQETWIRPVIDKLVSHWQRLRSIALYNLKGQLVPVAHLLLALSSIRSLTLGGQLLHPTINDYDLNHTRLPSFLDMPRVLKELVELRLDLDADDDKLLANAQRFIHAYKIQPRLIHIEAGMQFNETVINRLGASRQTDLIRAPELKTFSLVQFSHIRVLLSPSPACAVNASDSLATALDPKDITYLLFHLPQLEMLQLTIVQFDSPNTPSIIADLAEALSRDVGTPQLRLLSLVYDSDSQAQSTPLDTPEAWKALDAVLSQDKWWKVHKVLLQVALGNGVRSAERMQAAIEAAGSMEKLNEQGRVRLQALGEFEHRQIRLWRRRFEAFRSLWRRWSAALWPL